MKSSILLTLLLTLTTTPLLADEDSDKALDKILFQKLVEIRNEHNTEIRITALSGINQDGQSCVLYRNPQGYLTKAGDVGSIAEQLNGASIADGSYKRLAITLDTGYNSEAIRRITDKDNIRISGYIRVANGKVIAEGMQDKD